MELLSKYEVSIFNYPASEIENDVLNATKMRDADKLGRFRV